MTIEISKNKTIAEVQDNFSELYPFLKLDFYKKSNS